MKVSALYDTYTERKKGESKKDTERKKRRK
jgi:hypothetical protein